MKNEIEKLRKTRGLSQAKLADLAGMTQQSICRVESGERDISISEGIRIASVLGCKVKDLIIANQAEHSALGNIEDLSQFATPGTLVTTIRKKSGVSIDSIASSLGISKATYNKIEEDSDTTGGLKPTELSYNKALDICTIILMLRNFNMISKNMTASQKDRTLTEDQEQIINTYDSLAKADKSRALLLLKSLSPSEN